VRLRPLATAVAVGCALAACTGEANDPAPTARPTVTGGPTAEPTPECPQPPPSKEQWPKQVPEFVPKPPGLKIDQVDTSKENVVQVKSTVPLGMTDSVRFIVREFPRAGFTLGRGDAERTEADAPFQRGPGLRGLVRVFATNQQCRTIWLYAVVQDVDAPYDITYTPPPSSTPLPFG
jgi:hypothetical protein